jgi:hypothetical protein
MNCFGNGPMLSKHGALRISQVHQLQRMSEKEEGSSYLSRFFCLDNVGHLLLKVIRQFRSSGKK